MRLGVCGGHVTPSCSQALPGNTKPGVHSNLLLGPAPKPEAQIVVGPVEPIPRTWREWVYLAMRRIGLEAVFPLVGLRTHTGGKPKRSQGSQSVNLEMMQCSPIFLQKPICEERGAVCPDPDSELPHLLVWICCWAIASNKGT